MREQLVTVGAHVIAAGGGGTDHLTQIIAGVAGLFGAYSAYRLNKRDIDARAFARAKSQRDDLEADVVTLRRVRFLDEQIAASAGVVLSPVPRLKHEDWPAS